LFPKAKTDSEKAIGKAFLQKSEQILIQAKLKIKDDNSLINQLRGCVDKLKIKF
jgi:hypothetical protein